MAARAAGGKAAGVHPAPDVLGHGDELVAVAAEGFQEVGERNEPPIDTVRGAFIEGSPIYRGAGFRAKNHIQLCVRNLSCIKGYFRPLSDEGTPLTFI